VWFVKCCRSDFPVGECVFYDFVSSLCGTTSNSNMAIVNDSH
jgi:hypothetical protein